MTIVDILKSELGKKVSDEKIIKYIETLGYDTEL